MIEDIVDIQRKELVGQFGRYKLYVVDAIEKFTQEACYLYLIPNGHFLDGSDRYSGTYCHRKTAIRIGRKEVVALDNLMNK